jgi:hypothetical protein
MNANPEPGVQEGAGLEPLGRYRAGGMSTSMRAIFDVLYEEDRPLTSDEIAERTFERATGAAKGHARRVIMRQRQRDRRRYSPVGRMASDRGITEPPLELSWRLWTVHLLTNAVRRGSVLRSAEEYEPNPEKPPRAKRPDGTYFSYTREASLRENAAGRAVDQVQSMRMEADRLLGPLTQDELLIALEQLVLGFSGFKRGKRGDRARPVDPRTIRTRLRFLLERPTTDEARAWLLHELVRRIYETD